MASLSRQERQVERAARALEQHILHPAAWLQRVSPLTRTFVLAVSGGMDSAVLAHLMAALAEEHNWELHVAHFDHGLRPTSAEDAEFVRALAEQYGQAFHVQRWEPQEKYRNGLEAAARAARYRFVASVARQVTPEHEKPTALTAHHHHDQAETLLLNFVRSGNIQGAAGMLSHSDMPEQGNGRRVQLVRPMLHWKREEVALYSRLYNLTWCEDETNALPHRPRTIIRHLVLPELERINPRAVDHLADRASELRVLLRNVEERAAGLLAVSLVSVDPGIRIALALQPLTRIGAGPRGDVLIRAVRDHLPGAAESGGNAARRIAHALDHSVQATGPHPLINGFVWTILPAFGTRPDLLCIHHADALPIEPENPWLDDPEHLAARPIPLDGATRLLSGWALRTDTVPAPAVLVGASPWEAFLDADRCGEPVLTGWKPGMRIAPLGLEGHTRAVGDVFTDRKVPNAFRSGWPVLLDQQTGCVLWLCGLVVAHKAAVTAETRRILRLRWTRGEQP